LDEDKGRGILFSTGKKERSKNVKQSEKAQKSLLSLKTAKARGGPQVVFEIEDVSFRADTNNGPGRSSLEGDEEEEGDLGVFQK